MSRFAGPNLRAAVHPVGPESAGLDVVRQGGVENFVDDPVAQDAVLDRKQDLDPAVQIARHPVGAAHVDLRLTGVLKIADPAVLQKPVHDAAHGDVLAQAGHPGLEAADAADDEVDFHPRLGRLVQRLNHGRLHERIQLGDDPGGQAALRVFGLAGDQFQNSGAEVERCHDELARGLKLADARQQIKQVGGVLAELRTAGQQAEIGVKLGGGGIVIARGQMDVAPDLQPLAPDHQGALGVDLVADQAEDHVHAVLLEFAGPLDVVRLVKPGAQLHHHRHLLALIYRVHQGADDPRVAPGAIEGHLDGEHVRICGGRLQKGDDRGIIFVGMMQQDVALADGGEQILPAAQAGGHGGHEGRVAQLRRMVALIQQHQPGGVERALDEIQIIPGEIEGFEEQLADGFRAVVGDLQPDGVAPAALVELLLDGLEQVRRVLLVHIQLAVAGEAERPVAQDFRARKQVGEKVPDQLAEKDIVPRAVGARQADQSRQDGRALDHGQALHRGAVFFDLQPDDDVERLVEELRKRMGRIDGERREDRAHLPIIERVQPLLIGAFDAVQLEQPDAVPGQGRAELIPPAGVLVRHHFPDAVGEGLKDSGRRLAVHAATGLAAFNPLLQPGHPDLEKLIQVGADNGEKLEPLQQRVLVVQRLVQHALVEFHPAQLAIEKM